MTALGSVVVIGVGMGVDVGVDSSIGRLSAGLALRSVCG